MDTSATDLDFPSISQTLRYRRNQCYLTLHRENLLKIINKKVKKINKRVLFDVVILKKKILLQKKLYFIKTYHFIIYTSEVRGVTRIGSEGWETKMQILIIIIHKDISGPCART